MWNFTVEFYPPAPPTQMDAIIDGGVQVLAALAVWIPIAVIVVLVLWGAVIVVDSVISSIRGKK